MPASSVKLPKVSQYVRNVGKSVAFASINAVKSNMEGLSGFIDSNNEVFVEMYSSIKNYRDTIKKAEKSIKNSDLYRAIEYGTKNIIEDAKTGNFYNDRTSEISETSIGVDDESLGLDFDYEVSYGNSSNRSISDTFNDAMRASTIGTTTAVAKGTDMVVRSTKASTTIISSQIERSTATIHSGLGAVYNSISQVNQFLNGPMLTHLENSRIYYDNSLKIMQEQHAMMREMLEMQRNLYGVHSKQYKTSKFDQSTSASGMMDMRGYTKIVKENIMNYFGIDGIVDSGMNIPLMLAASPFKMLLDGLADGLMPKNFKKNIKNLDTTLTGMFSHFISKINKNKNSSGFKGLLAEIFGISIEDKNSINTSNYNKGAVPFDGITRKTIIEVIPGYLARIESALTGAAERHYDPHKGVWKSAKRIEQEFEMDRINTIESANRSITYDIYGDKRFKSKKYQNAIKRIKEQIYEDGYFDPEFIYDKNSRADSTGRRKRSVSEKAYNKYGNGLTKKELDLFVSALTDGTISNLAFNNIKAKQNRSRRLQGYEEQGGIFNILFNDSYNTGDSKSGAYSSPSKFATGGLLNASTDKYGKNIFYYLREILKGINGRWKSGSSGRPVSGGPSGTTRVKVKYRSRESKTSSESEGDPGSDDDAWDEVNSNIEEDERKAAEEYAKKNAAKNFVKDAVNKSSFSKKLNKLSLSNVLASPFKFMDDMLERANNNMFSLMFGDKRLKDAEGKDIDNVFEYIINQVKKSFEDIGKYVKSLFNPLWDKFKKWFAPKWDKYGKPVVGALKNYGSRARSRIVTGLDNTIGRAFDTATATVDDRMDDYTEARDFASEAHNATGDRARTIQKAMYNRNMTKDQWKKYYSAIRKARRGEISSANEVAGTASAEDINNPGIITQNAFGTRYVTKRGLTMISPGEMIIPASSNPAVLNKMLNKEIRDKNKILNSIRAMSSKDIDLNAKGTVDTSKLRSTLSNIWNENTGENAAKVGAGGIVGLGAGLVTGFNPFLAALAGAGLSVLNNSDTLKNIVFGEVADNKTGEREGGIISKKIQDTFKKYAPDMGDFGIAGGVLGLLTPFGPFMGAAIGAGIGFLKNSEGFKKFIFGEEGEDDGLISKEAYNAFKDRVKKAAPKMLLGAGAGILAGPFGLLGNAALGAGVGLISTTETFQNFLYGEADENGERNGGVVGAFKRGILQPAKEKFLEFAADLKEYSKKHIIEPMKNFWKPVHQMLKNVINSVGDGIKDFVNDMFERTIGLPLHDFLQEKIFKPVGKLVFGILKAPYKLAKGIFSLPFAAAQGIGNSIRASQIRRGTAYDMTANERLAWRDQHNIRFNKFNRYADKRLLQDQKLAGMELGDLEGVYQAANVGLTSYRSLQKDAIKARNNVGEEVSKFFNTADKDSKIRFNKVGYKTVNELTKIAQTKSAEEVNNYINGMKNLSNDEKEDLKKKIAKKLKTATDANSALNLAKNSDTDLNKILSDALGYNVKGRKDKRRIMRSAEAELNARRKLGERANESPEVNATNNFAEIYSKTSKNILDQLIAANTSLSALVNPNKKDTKPPSDRNNEIKNNDVLGSENKSNNTALALANEEIRDAKKKKSKNSIFSRIAAAIGFGGVNYGDEDSKEAKDAEKIAEEKDKDTRENVKANKDSVSILSKIKEALVGKKDTEETGLLGKLWKGIGTVGKYIGIGGLALTGVSLFGHLSQWFKIDIWPKMKTLLFGTKDEEGNVLQQGLIGKFGTTIKHTLLGEDGYSGLLGGLRRVLFGDEGGNGGLFGQARGVITEWWENAQKWLGEKIDGVANWLRDEGGLKGIFTNHVIPGFVNGLGYAINNILPPAIGALIKAAPTLIADLAEAIWEGIKIGLFNKEVKRSSGSKITIGDGGASKELEAAQSAINSSVEGADKTGTVSSIKGAWGNFKSALSGSATVDFSSSGSSSSSDVNNKVADGVLGKLGQTNRTNTIQYDENGNIITDYTRWNTTDSLGSYVAKAAGKSFIKGLGGNTVGLKALRGAGGDVAKATANLAKPGLLSKIKSAFGFTKATAKAGVNTVGAAGSAGSGLHNLIDSMSDAHIASSSNGKFLANSVDDVAEAASKKGIIGKIAKFFTNLAGDNKVIGAIASSIRTFTGKEGTEALIKSAIKKIGDKLGDTIVSKVAKTGLKAIGNILSKFSILTILSFATDFIWGYNNAHTILGIAVDSDFDVNLGHKCVCGIVNVITNFFTLGLIPADTIMDIVIEFLFPLFKLDNSAIVAARDQGGDILDTWNKENPDKTFDNMQDYNYYMKNKDKWWYKAKENVKSGWEETKTKIKDYVWPSIKNGATNLVSNMGTSIKSFIDGIITVVPQISNVSKNMIANAWKAKGESDRDETIPETGNGLVDNIAKIALGIIKVYNSPTILLGKGVNLLKDGFKTIINKWSIAKNTKKTDDTKMKDALDGKISVFSSEYWTNADQSKNGIFGGIVTVQTYVEKIMNAPVAIIKNIITTVSDSFAGIKEWFGDKFESIWDWFTGFFGSGKNKDKSKNKSASSTTSGVVAGGIMGSRLMSGSGRFGKGHIYQSGAISNMPYGDSTIGDSGCAPVAAANLTGGSVKDAARFAERNGMTVPGGGTDIDFFNHYLGSKGISTRNTSSKSGVMKALANGHQVVMLGRDNYDNGAPFGTTPHYITAKGISRNGNIIVEDPDLPYANIEYTPNDVMNSMITSVIAGDGRHNKRFGRKRRWFGRGKEEYDLLANGGYLVTSPYDEMRDGKMHRALDLAKNNNDPIYAFTNGTVKYMENRYTPNSGMLGSSDGGGFGNYVTLIDNNGYYHVYGHLNGTNVSVGQRVNRGQQIGIQGHTGSSSGSHLHYQISSGSVTGPRYDPYEYLLNYNGSGSSNTLNSSGTTSSSSSYSSSSGSSSNTTNNTSTNSNSKSTTGNLLTALGNLGTSIVKKLFGADAYNALFGSDSSSAEYADDVSTSNNNSNNGSTSSNSSYNTGATMSGNYTTQKIWNMLRAKGYTKAGTAGIMGNFNAESGYRTNNMEDYYNSKLGLTDEQYTEQVSNGTYSKSRFINDAVGYGLPQFTYYTLKESLYNHTVSQGKRIDDLQGQINALASQLSTSYVSLDRYLKSTNDVAAASDKFLVQYENPAVKDYSTRQKYAWQAYNKYANSETAQVRHNNNTYSVAYGRSRSNNAGIATNALNSVRGNIANRTYTSTASNNGIVVDYATFLKTIVEILITISNNTSMLNSILEILSSKFDIKIDANQVTDATKNNTRAQAQRALNKIMNSNTDAANFAKIMNNKDTQYLINAMAAIASE